MQDKLILLGKWGCEIDSAIERLCDDEELLIDCINLFIKDKGFCDLDKNLANSNYAEAFENAHMLKGVAANLGLTPIFISISEIVESLRKQETSQLDIIYKKVLEEYNKLIEIMK